MVSEILESDKLHLLLLFDGIRIDDNECLESLETATELIVCTEEQIQKFTFQKHSLSIKHRVFSMTSAFRLAAF